MSTRNDLDPEMPGKRKHLPPWAAYPLALIVWEAVPWAVSLLSGHYRWVMGRPGIWNLTGLAPVLLGTAGLILGVHLHSAQSPEGIQMEMDKTYLLMRGPYAFSRHPMYVSELILLLGWVIFYGSAAVLIEFVIWCIFFSYLAPLEERRMEAHFGEAYRDYKKKVPRWFGPPRS